MVRSKSTAPDHLAFADAGRDFECTVGPRCASDASRWWWFSVSTGGKSRYAFFAADEDDTSESVQARVVADYDNMLARRAAPSVQRWRRATPSAAVEANADMAGAPAGPAPTA